MEDLIRSKIAELEVNFPEQLVEQKLAEEFVRIENETTFDESAICRDFDSAVIDERNPLENRIQSVRELFLYKTTSAKKLEKVYLNLVADHKSKCQEGNQLRDELKRLELEKHTNEDLRVRLQDMNKLLQRQIKEVAEESRRLRELEQQRMEELSVTFTSTIEDITHKIGQQEEEQIKQAGDNQQLREKLSEFSGHSELREQHFNSQLQAKQLELQLVEARIAQGKEVLSQEKRRCERSRSDINQINNNKATLKEQIQLYSEKFLQFQDALTRSEAMFGQFEERVASLASTAEELKTERDALKQETGTLDVQVLAEFDKKQALHTEAEKKRRGKEALATRCRELQTQRTELRRRAQELAPAAEA